MKFNSNHFLKGIGSGDSRITVFDAIEMAQATLDQWLKEAPTVYSHEGEVPYDAWSHKRINMDTHQAKLLCIEEIKKECEHEPWEVFYDYNLPAYKCNNCNKILKATWSPCE